MDEGALARLGALRPIPDFALHLVVALIQPLDGATNVPAG
jgi:hypothetical protein